MEALGNISTTSRSLAKNSNNQQNKPKIIAKKDSVNKESSLNNSNIELSKPVNDLTTTSFNSSISYNKINDENQLLLSTDSTLIINNISYKSNLAEPSLKKQNKKKVVWADSITSMINGNGIIRPLENVQYFYLDEIEREIKRSAHKGGDIAKIEKLNEKELRFKMHSPEDDLSLNNTNNWPTSLIPIDLPDTINIPEIKSIEHEIQLKREQDILAVLMFKQFLPDSPSEPSESDNSSSNDLSDFNQTKLIPLDDVSLNTSNNPSDIESTSPYLSSSTPFISSINDNLNEKFNNKKYYNPSSASIIGTNDDSNNRNSNTNNYYYNHHQQLNQNRNNQKQKLFDKQQQQQLTLTKANNNLNSLINNSPKSPPISSNIDLTNKLLSSLTNPITPTSPTTTTPIPINFTSNNNNSSDSNNLFNLSSKILPSFEMTENLKQILNTINKPKSDDSTTSLNETTITTSSLQDILKQTTKSNEATSLLPTSLMNITLDTDQSKLNKPLGNERKNTKWNSMPQTTTTATGNSKQLMSIQIDNNESTSTNLNNNESSNNEYKKNSNWNKNISNNNRSNNGNGQWSNKFNNNFNQNQRNYDNSDNNNNNSGQRQGFFQKNTNNSNPSNNNPIKPSSPVTTSPNIDNVDDNSNNNSRNMFSNKFHRGIGIRGDVGGRQMNSFRNGHQNNNNNNNNLNKNNFQNNNNNGNSSSNNNFNRGNFRPNNNNFNNRNRSNFDNDPLNNEPKIQKNSNSVAQGGKWI